MSNCRNDVHGLLKNRKAAGNRSVSLEMSSAHMAETVAFKPARTAVRRCQCLGLRGMPQNGLP
uniref:Uncharacterized protein n=1 Tax=Romanomermis culicivorax TaxID=13658 RepID=A0A915L7L7_ROMCU